MASVLWDEQGYSGCFAPGFSIHSGPPTHVDVVIIAPQRYVSRTCTTTARRPRHVVMALAHGMATRMQKQKYLPGSSTGDTIVAIAMTEPAAGAIAQCVPCECAMCLV